jgi:hypothetical protein
VNQGTGGIIWWKNTEGRKSRDAVPLSKIFFTMFVSLKFKIHVLHSTVHIQNVERQNIERQNVERQNVELQNVDNYKTSTLQNVESQIVDSAKMHHKLWFYIVSLCKINY